MPEAVPAHVSSAAFPQNRLILFVHGILSKPKCWDQLLKFLSPGLAQRGFTDQRFEYKTKALNLDPRRSIPAIEDAASRLAGDLQGKYKDYDQVTLVGHSQGGLIIQRYLANELEKRQGAHLSRIWVVIFLATPNFGSLLLHPIRWLVFKLFKNAQELALRPLNEETAETLLTVNERVVRARKRASDEFPIRIQCFWGDEDNIVHRVSARGMFDNYKALRGDHSSILEPASSDDERCTRLLEVLDDPPGHANFWEIERYETTLEVEPREMNPPYRAEYGRKGEYQRDVRTDNFSKVTKRVTFSQKNICRDSFVLDYMTHNVEGFVRGDFRFIPGEPGDKNRWSVKEEERYNETGRDYTFRFTPRLATAYELIAEIYGGFNEGNRSIDFDLGERLFCRMYYFRLDLTKYLTAGWAIKAPKPELAIHMDDRKTARGEVIPYSTSSDGQGLYTWQIADIHNKGVKVSVKWDVVKM